MEALKKEGLAKNIGLSNFNEFQLNRVLQEASIVPAIHQIESHPYLTEEPMIAFCKKNNIAVTAYCPLGSKQRMGCVFYDSRRNKGLGDSQRNKGPYYEH